MWFTSDNASGAAPEIMAALARANGGYARSYGADPAMDSVRALVRAVFEAPEAEVHLVATGTAANALALSLYCPPWGAILAHDEAHVAMDECGAPELFAGGARVAPVAGPHGRMTADGLAAALARLRRGDVHSLQPAILSITNVTEAGTVYSVDEVAALSAQARAAGLAVHMDGSRLANALAATGASPAQMTWGAGVDVLSLGATKNGCLGVEAVVLFDPAKSWEFELRRKRGGHLFSKNRFLAAQIEAYLTDGLWLRLAGHANAMGARLAQGLARLSGVELLHPVEANILFPLWPLGTNERTAAAGIEHYRWPAPDGRDAGRLVASWSTTEADVDALLAAVAG